MQLKRDTDYALRILHCINTLQSSNSNKYGTYPTISDITLYSGVSKTPALRICGKLCNSQILKVYKDNLTGKEHYMLPDVKNSSLLDVIEAVEKSCNIFAVFDKKSSFYKNHETYLASVQNDMFSLLSNTSLYSLIK